MIPPATTFYFQTGRIAREPGPNFSGLAAPPISIQIQDQKSARSYGRLLRSYCR